jgi:glucuronosyltransferase
MNPKIILNELVQRDHEITVLTASASILIEPTNESSINFEIYSVPLSKNNLENIFGKCVDEWIHDFQKPLTLAILFKTAKKSSVNIVIALKISAKQ